MLPPKIQHEEIEWFGCRIEIELLKSFFIDVVRIMVSDDVVYRDVVVKPEQEKIMYISYYCFRDRCLVLGLTYDCERALTAGY